MTKIYDALVIGGGPVGLATAIGIGMRHFSVALIDADLLSVDINKPDSRIFAVNHASQRLLMSLEVWSLIPIDQLSPYQHMSVWDAANAQRIDFDCRMIATDRLGWMIEESVLYGALLTRIAQLKNISIFPKQVIETVDEQVDTICVANSSQSWIGRHLFATDGANSPCRKQLKVPLTTWPYHQDAVVATVVTEHAHQQTAYQIFHPEGPLAFLPLRDPHRCGIVWSTAPAHAKSLLSLSTIEFNQVLTTAFQNKLGSVTHSQGRNHFPLVMRHVEAYVGTHWVLLGDAAHTIHPLAGLGLNVGLADLTAYLELLDQKPGQWPSKQQLARFQRQRKYAVWQVITLMQALKELFSTDSLPVRLLRGLGINCCNHVPMVKRLLIKHAAGI